METKQIESGSLIPPKPSLNEAIVSLEENSRNSIFPDWARDIAEALNCKLDKKLIRTGKGYREQVRDMKEEKVTVSCLAESICEQLSLEPDEELLEVAGRMNGVGRIHDLSTWACCKVLRKHFGMKEVKY